MAAPVEDAEKYPRRVLLAVTGLSPQIVTETLYALAVASRPAWIPTEIQIITTRTGEEKARLTLLSSPPHPPPLAGGGGEGGWFRRLREDFSLPEIAFGNENIRVITGPDGKPLDDILTDSDNVAVADFITQTVRELTADPTASLRVSIAGGRKTWVSTSAMHCPYSGARRTNSPTSWFRRPSNRYPNFSIRLRASG
jgi:CRISPR-associated protein (TIGR02584 family)